MSKTKFPKAPNLDKKTRNFLIILGSITGVFIIICAIIILTVQNKDTTPAPADPDVQFQQESYENAEKYAAEHPAITVLPIQYAAYDENYNYTEFRIDGGDFRQDGCSTDFCLKITDESEINGTYPQNPDPTTLETHEAKIRTLANDLLRKKSQDPDTYEILYSYKPVTPLK